MKWGQLRVECERQHWQQLSTKEPWDEIIFSVIMLAEKHY
jgi:hypothetical protein